MADPPAPPANPDQAAAAPLVRRWSLAPERLISIIAIATAIYYIAAFAYEVGFFWEIGPVYMSAFTMADHIAHAATLAMISAGGFLVLCAGYVFMLAVGEGGATAATEAGTPTPEQVSPVGTGKWSRRVWAFIGVAWLAAYFYMLVWPEILMRPGPGSLLQTVGCVFVLVLIYVLSRPEGEREKAAKFVIMPAVLIPALIPSAAGEWAYQEVIEHPAPVPLILGTAPIGQGSAIFVGSSRLIVATDQGLYLLSDDGTFRMTIKR